MKIYDTRISKLMHEYIYLQVDHRKYRETSIREEGKAWVAFTLLMLLLLMILSTVLYVTISNYVLPFFFALYRSGGTAS